MVDVFPQGAPTEQTPAIYALDPSGAVLPSPDGPTPAQPFVPDDRGVGAGSLTTNTLNKPSGSPETFPGQEVVQSTAGFDWFEDFHVIPRSFEFGNLLSAQSIPVEVFSGFRRLPKQEWATFVNNAGSGVTLTGLPSLPTDVDPLSGIQMTLDVSTMGDPFVDATLDFGFTGIGTISLPIMIQRIVLWGLPPELPYDETLGFLTDVKTRKGGKERRHSLRKSPRRVFGFNYLIDEGTTAQVLENLLFDFQGLTFGVPGWFEDTELSAGISAGATSITVPQTAYRDFRVGSLVVILESQSTFDVLEIDSLTATTIDFTSPTVNAYLAGTPVYPLNTCRANPVVRGGRWPIGLRRMRIDFEPTTNDLGIEDLSAFSSFSGSLLLDNGNSILGTVVGDAFEQEVIRIDGEVGLVFRESPWDRHKRRHEFTLRASGRQAVWEMRQMLWAIRGRQVPFWVPRDSEDLVPVANLVSGANTIDVTNVGYQQFVRDRQPKNVIRVNFVDGSSPLIRTVTGSTMTSSTVDQLTLDGTWPSTITPAEVSKVDYLEKVRFDTDRIRMSFDSSGHRARMIAPVKTVFE